jgi:hypothetical protein
MVSVGETTYAGLPRWVKESSGLPGSPFCEDGGFGEEFPRGLTCSEIFHSRLDEASRLVRQSCGVGNLSEINSVVSKVITQNGAEVASRFFRTGANSIESLLRFSKFLFLNNNNLECFIIVNTVIKSFQNKKTQAVV